MPAATPAPHAEPANPAATGAVLIFRGLPAAQFPAHIRLTPLALHDPSTSDSALTSALPTTLYLLHSPAAPFPAHVVEIARLSTPHSTWLLRPHPPSPSRPARLEPPGDVLIVSRVDPLFAALPMLTARRESPSTPRVPGAPSRDDPGVFQPAPALLLDAQDRPFLAALLPAATSAPAPSVPALHALCDVHHVTGDTYYRLSIARVMQWLCSRAAQCGVDAVCAYLSAPWEERLRAESAASGTGNGNAKGVVVKADTERGEGIGLELAFEEMRRSARANPEAGREMNWEDRYDGNSGKGAVRKVAKKVRTSATQNKLQKVDTRGMRSMRSYFGKK